jgi:hypothetical protein
MAGEFEGKRTIHTETGSGTVRFPFTNAIEQTVVYGSGDKVRKDAW